MTFDSSYYDHLYFSDIKGKSFKRPDGSIDYWGYKNKEAEWLGCGPIVKAWNNIFNLSKYNTNSGCKSLDVGCGRGTFVAYMRDIGIDALGFDFSEWAINNLYPRCNKKWARIHDATQKWPYEDKYFDLVIVLDLLEHIYLEDIDFVLEEIHRVSKKWIFLQIATIGMSDNEKGYIIKKGENIPIELEGMAVAGHVTVQPRNFWIVKLKSIELRNKDKNNKWKLRDDLVQEFIRKVPNDVISNWIKNTILILEKVE